MKITEALEKSMLTSRQIHRTSWEGKFVIYLYYGELRILPNRRVGLDRYIPSVTDLLATDWDIHNT